MPETEGKRILGIDPGTIVMGYGLIEIKNNKPEILHVGVVKTKGFNDHYLRLKHIFIRTKALIDEYLPDELAIESPFYGKDIQAMLKLGRAQGIVMGLALQHDIPVFACTPDLFPELMAAAIKKLDLKQWAGDRDIVLKG